MTPELLAALKTLESEHIGDFIYNVRESEGLNWEGPRVKAFGEACEVITNFLKEHAHVSG